MDSYMQKNETWPLSHTIHKDKLQMDERHRCDTGIHQNILEENIGSNLYDISHSNFFHYTSPKARETEKMNLWNFIKIKSFGTAKETVKKTKRQPTEREKIFANDTTDKRLASKIYKEVLKLNTQETNKSQNGQKIRTDTFPMKTYKWLTDTWKNAQNH